MEHMGTVIDIVSVGRAAIGVSFVVLKQYKPGSSDLAEDGKQIIDVAALV